MIPDFKIGDIVRITTIDHNWRHWSKLDRLLSKLLKVTSLPTPIYGINYTVKYYTVDIATLDNSEKLLYDTSWFIKTNYLSKIDINSNLSKENKDQLFNLLSI